MKRKTPYIVATVILFIALAFFLAPIYLAVITSFKTPMEIAETIMAFPKSLNLANYIDGMKKSDFARSLRNSATITFPSVALIVLFSSMGGYSIARNSSWSKLIKSLDSVYLASLMIPFQILMIPVYKIFKNLGLQNNLGGMILMLTGYSIAYATFLYVGFVKSVPRELEEAALIDGCGPLQMFFRIVFPLLKPITATVAALHVMWLWNDFQISIILLQKDKVRTLTVKQFYFFGQYTSEYGMAFAASIVAMMPVVIVFMLLQKYIVAGISAGAVKS